MARSLAPFSGRHGPFSERHAPFDKKNVAPCIADVPFLAHLALRPCELLSSLFVRRPSVNISHFNLLLRNHWANCNQTLVEWSLDGPLLKLCPVIPTSNQDGAKLKIEKRGMKF